jgi:hypothetical protein
MESITKTIMLDVDELDLTGLYTDRTVTPTPVTELLTLLLLAVRNTSGSKHGHIDVGGPTDHHVFVHIGS